MLTVLRTVSLATFVAVLLLVGSAVTADVQALSLSRYFSDGLVVQRDQPWVVTGFARPGSTVSVAFAGSTQTATADAQGRWSAAFPALPASAKGRELTCRTGDQTVSISDVVVGDVFLFGRQTTVDITLGRTDQGRADAKAYQPAGVFRAISIQTRPATEPQADLDPAATAGWFAVDSGTAPGMTGSAFYFGRDLAQTVGVPVGVIDLNMGAYFAFGWMSQSAIQGVQTKYPDDKELGWLPDYMRERLERRESGEEKRELMENYQEYLERHGGDFDPPELTMHPLKDPLFPSAGYNAVIHPLRDIKLKSVLLQLGNDYPFMHYLRLEETGKAQSQPELYHAWVLSYRLIKNGFRVTPATLPYVPRDWRQAFGDPALPVGLIMPPSSDVDIYAKHNREIRELQRRVAADTPHTGVILPGMDNHPFSGQPTDDALLASRATQWVLGSVYQQADVTPAGPTIARLESTGFSTATLHFEPGTAQGLAAASDTALDHFEVAGPDQVFSPAQAVIDGNTIKLTSDSVGFIASARYNWHANPSQDLVNEAGLPAVPFNTDAQWAFGWLVPATEPPLPDEYNTTADEWGDSDVAIINGQVSNLQSGDSEAIPRRPGPLGIYSSPFGPNIYIISIAEGGPADGKLRPKDLIYGVNREKFIPGDQDNVYLALADAITYSESHEGGGKLELMVRRDGKLIDVTLQLNVMGSYSSTSPYFCPKSEKIVEMAEQWVYDRFRPESGHIDSGTGMLHTDMLFLLASGNPKHQGLVRRAVYDIMEKMDPLQEPDPNKGGHNWNLGYTSMLLGEYYHATGDTNVLPYLLNLTQWAAMTQLKSAQDAGPDWQWEVAQSDEQVGGWRHRGPTAADRWMSGYGLMAPAGVPCVMGMVYADEAGLDIDRAALDRGLHHFHYQRAEHAFVEYLYWNLRREAPAPINPEAEANGKLSSLNGKNAVAAALFRLVDDHQAVDATSRTCVYAYNNTRYGHGGMYFNNMWTAIGAHAAGPEGFKHFMQGNRWWRELFRKADGSFNQVGRGGIGVAYAIPYAAPRQRLRMLGAPRTAFSTDCPDYLRPVVEVYQDRDYTRAQQMLSRIMEESAIPGEDMPVVNHLKTAIQTMIASIDHDLAYTQRMLAEGKHVYARAELAQLKGVLPADDDRLRAIETALESEAGLAALNKHEDALGPRPRNQRESAKTPDDRRWVALKPQRLGKSAGDIPPAENADSTWVTTMIEVPTQAPVGWAEPGFDDADWSPVEPPISWAMYHTTLYRGKFHVEDKSRVEALRLRCILFRQSNVLIYINGKLAGKIDQIGRGNEWMNAELTDYAVELLKDGENTVAFSTRHMRRWGPLRGNETTFKVGGGISFSFEAAVKE